MVFLTIKASEHPEANTDEFYFEDETLIDDLVEDANDDDIEVRQ